MLSCKLLFCLVVLVLPHISFTEDGFRTWNGLTRYTTANEPGLPCISKCSKRRSRFYWCHVGWDLDVQLIDSKGNYAAYCSPEPNTTHYGIPCVTSCNDDNWCEIDYYGNWGHCGKTLPGPDATGITIYKTRYDKTCLSGCAKSPNGTSILHWCHLENDEWDYCSPENGRDVKGNVCKSSCDFHGERYKWCRLRRGGWNYCGVSEYVSRPKLTLHGTKCITTCEIQPNTRDFFCFDAGRKLKKCNPDYGIDEESYL